MKLDCVEGTKIEFVGEDGLDHDIKQAEENLKKGDIYTVKSMYVGKWDSSVTLEENGETYNTVMFETIEPYEKYDWFGDNYRRIV